MIIKHSKWTAICVAVAVWFAYSMPARAATLPKKASNSPTSVVQTDDDDDELSGWALAVLLLAIGGAVAGVLYAAHPGGVGDKIACDRANNEVTLRLSNTDPTGATRRSTWSGKLDDKSGTITLIRKSINAARKVTQTEWNGKVDGKYYSVKGDSDADEISFTKIDANTLEFSAKKGDRVTLTGRMAVSNNGRSFTVSTGRPDSTGRRITKQTTYSSVPTATRNP